MNIETCLRTAAVEIAEQGINGWGNLCSDAADEIERLRAKLAECEREIERLNTVCDTYDYENQRLFYRAERLEAAIRDAPHGSSCWDGAIVHSTGEVLKCNCWKRDALEDK